MATRSFHNLPDSMVWDHNRRDPEYVKNQPHIDPNLSHLNRFLVNKNPEEAFNEIFKEDIEEYNKGKRPSRQIKNYYKKIRAARDRDLKKCIEEPTYVDKKGRTRKRKPTKPAPIQESIVGVYNTGLSTEEKINLLTDFYEAFNECFYPHLRIIGAYIHADETDSDVHLHLDQVTVIENNIKGPKHKVASREAYLNILNKYGVDFEKYKKDWIKANKASHKNKGLCTPQNVFEHEVAGRLLEEIAKQNYGVASFEHPQKGKGVKHLDTINFKLQTQIEKKEKVIENKNKEIEIKEQVLDAKKVRNSHLTASLNNAKQNLKTSTETLMSDKERLEQANKRLTELKQIYNELKIKSPTSSLQNSVSRNNFLPQQELRALEEKLEEKKKSNEKLRLEQAKLQRQLNDSLTLALKRTGLKQNSISLKTILDQV